MEKTIWQFIKRLRVKSAMTCCLACVVLLIQPSMAQNRDAVKLSSFFGYPLTLGDVTTDNLHLAVNKLLPENVELDNLPRYQIGAIPNQTVWHEGDITVGFYVLIDTMKSTNVLLSRDIDFPPEGTIIFDEQTGRFKYYPDISDVRDFTVTFTAQSGSKEMTQVVKFTLMPATPPEYSAFGVRKEWTSSNDDYTISGQSKLHENMLFNNAYRDTRSISISGKELVFDQTVNNKLKDLELTESDDIEELNLFADKIIIRDPLHFKQTNVTIYAKELVFEDRDGATACINTSPEPRNPIPASGNGIDNSGENAGDITLYIKEFKHTKPAVRFYSAGGNGKDVSYPQETDGTKINGGNGGNLTSTVDIRAFSVRTKGKAGVLRTNEGHVLGDDGTDGKFELYEKEFAWLHPNWVSVIVKCGKDAYLNIQNEFTYRTFSEYSQHIADFNASDEWDEIDNEIIMELTNAENEMQAIMLRISQNLDYFGNPVGWVPMLSFEANMNVLKTEIDQSINVMYLCYWLKNIDADNKERINALGEALESAKQDLNNNKVFINELERLISELQGEAPRLEEQIDKLVADIENKTRELLAKASSNVKKQNEYNQISGILSTVAKLAPVVCSIIPGVGTAVGAAISTAATAGNTALAKATGASDTYGYADAVGGFLDVAGGFVKPNGGFSDITTALKQIDVSKDNLGTTFNSAKDAYNTINKTVTPLISSVENLHKAFTQSSTPNEQVQAELDKLKAQSKEYQELIADAEALNTEKEQLMQKLTNTFNSITATSVEIQKNIAAVDGLGSQVFEGNSKRDLRALQYLDGMERRAKERLLQYFYYMAKSYEYRVLDPYPGELDLPEMFKRLKMIAESNQNSYVLTSTDFNVLKNLYNEQLSTVNTKIVDFYDSNYHEETIPIRFSLEKNDLDALNAGRGFNLNVYERPGLFPINRERARIVSIKVFSIDAKLEGEQNPSSAYFVLTMKHSGRSLMRKNGEIYWFDHYNNQNQIPITWGFDYYPTLEIPPDEHKQSFASESLISSILTNDNIMIYSRPGVWADIYVSKKDYISSSNSKIVINELTFELQYDYVERLDNIYNLDVYAVDKDKANYSLSPYIEVSASDINGRKNGRGAIYRTYNRNTNVRLTAPEKYGRYQFVNWTNNNNSVIVNTPNVTVSMTEDLEDVAYVANYQYTGAILSVADTIFIPANGSSTTVNVENIGMDEMKWKAVSNNSWLQITSGSEGTDDGDITLKYDANTSGAIRTGTLTIDSEDSETYETKTVYIVQSNVAATFTVAFDSQGGSEISPQTVEQGDKATQPKAPERSGFSFGGWYKEADCVNTWNFNTDIVTANMTLYAKWISSSTITFTVTFDTQGGNEISPQTVEQGDKATQPETPARSGYIFGGWYKEASCVNAWNFNTDIVTANMTLYAKWTEQTANAVISVTVSPSASTVKKGDSRQFTANVEVSGNASQAVTWSVSGNSLTTTNISETGLLAVAAGETAATLTVTATSVFDTSKTGSAKVTVESVTSAEEILFSDLNIYPNPFKGEVRIVGAEGCTLQVFVTTGLLVHTQMIISLDETIYLENLPSGVYFFRIEKEGKTQTKIVVKN